MINVSHLISEFVSSGSEHIERFVKIEIKVAIEVAYKKRKQFSELINKQNMQA
jgi:hypothetical protein